MNTVLDQHRCNTHLYGNGNDYIAHLERWIRMDKEETKKRTAEAECLYGREPNYNSADDDYGLDATHFACE